MYRRRAYKKKRRYGGRRGVPKKFRGRFRRVGNYGRFAGSTALISRPEWKIRDFVLTNEAILVAPGSNIVDSFNIIAQGLNETERTGARVTLRSLQIQGAVTQASGAAVSQTSNRVRIMLVLDKQCNGAAASVTDVINATPNGMRNVTNMARFTVLKQWFINMQATAGGSGVLYGEVIRNLTFYKKCNIRVHFGGAASSLSVVQSNNIFMIAMMDQSVPTVSVSLQLRIRYTDN